MLKNVEIDRLNFMFPPFMMTKYIMKFNQLKFLYPSAEKNYQSFVRKKHSKFLLILWTLATPKSNQKFIKFCRETIKVG